MLSNFVLYFISTLHSSVAQFPFRPPKVLFVRLPVLNTVPLIMASTWRVFPSPSQYNAAARQLGLQPKGEQSGFDDLHISIISTSYSTTTLQEIEIDSSSFQDSWNTFLVEDDRHRASKCSRSSYMLQSFCDSSSNTIRGSYSSTLLPEFELPKQLDLLDPYNRCCSSATLCSGADLAAHTEAISTKQNSPSKRSANPRQLDFLAQEIRNKRPTSSASVLSQPLDPRGSSTLSLMSSYSWSEKADSASTTGPVYTPMSDLHASGNRRLVRNPCHRAEQQNTVKWPRGEISAPMPVLDDRFTTCSQLEAAFEPRRPTPKPPTITKSTIPSTETVTNQEPEEQRDFFEWDEVRPALRKLQSTWTLRCQLARKESKAKEPKPAPVCRSKDSAVTGIDNIVNRTSPSMPYSDRSTSRMPMPSYGHTKLAPRSLPRAEVLPPTMSSPGRTTLKKKQSVRSKGTQSGNSSPASTPRKAKKTSHSIAGGKRSPRRRFRNWVRKLLGCATR